MLTNLPAAQSVAYDSFLETLKTSWTPGSPLFELTEDPIVTIGFSKVNRIVLLDGSFGTAFGTLQQPLAIKRVAEFRRRET